MTKNGPANRMRSPMTTTTDIQPKWEDGMSRRNLEFERTRIAGIDIITASRQVLTQRLTDDCLRRRIKYQDGEAQLLFDVNGQGVSLFRTNTAYRDAMLAADAIHADGGYLVTLSRLFLGPRIAERSATTDLIHDLAQSSRTHGLTYYLVGGDEALNKGAAEKLVELYPGLRIVGRHHGFFTVEDEEALIRDINLHQPDFIWVGLGKPLEQTVSVRWKSQVKAGWIITCGGCYNFLTGRYRRAPLWIQKANLEFLYRMALNPRALAWRYLTTSPRAFWLSLFR